MTPDLRAAAERLRRIANGEHLADVYNTREKPPCFAGEWGHWQAVDAARANIAIDNEFLADAWLAANLPDDDEPLTPEWLLRVGFGWIDPSDHAAGVAIGAHGQTWDV